MEREKKIKFSKKERMKIFWNELRIKPQIQIFKFFKTPNPKFSIQNFHSQV